MRTPLPAISTGLLIAALFAPPSAPVHAQGASPPAPAAPGSQMQRPGLPQVPRRSSSAPPANVRGTASVTGHIVALDTGLPIRRARIFIRGLRLGESQTILSGADGTFTFSELAADRYQMRAAKTRYVSGELGARRPGAQGRPFELAEGQRLAGITLSLSPGGVIVGRVVDEAGEPAAGTAVAALRHHRTPEGELHLLPTGESDTTDDNGSYRLYGLMPGRYVVVARSSDTDRLAGVVEAAPYPEMFFPGTALPGEAQPVEVVAGAEVAADIALAPTRLAVVRGVVVDQAGRPARHGTATLRHASRVMLGPSGHGAAGIGDGGTFALAGIPPGEYVLNVQASFPPDGAVQDGSSVGEEAFAVPLSVGGADISDLRIVVPPPATVTGRVVFEGADQSTEAHVSLNGARGLAASGNARIGRDGRFSLRVTPGARSIVAWGGRGWMLKRLIWNGRAIDSGDEIDVDAEGGRIDAVFTSQITAVTGSVVDASGRPAQDYQVVLFPDDGRLQRRWSDRIRFERADQDGRFRTDGLPPGRYLAIATIDLDPEEALDSELLEGFRHAATAFRLDFGETATLALTLASPR
jgi:hypothetical protein